MKKAFKIIFKEIGRILGVMAIPTFALYVGLLGREGIQIHHRMKAENAESYIITAILLYIAVTIAIIYSWYHEYYLPYKKRKEQQSNPQEHQEGTLQANKEEPTSSTIEPTSNEKKELTYWDRIVKPCKNIMTIVIVLIFIRFTIPNENWFLNIVFLGFLGYMIWCMNKANKDTNSR
ncbi:MAG: hypothetical protein M0P43_09765 [Arcobacteraceae bacterium]|jgi:hypothetical protein|nr:hypothetical protein [Arcobacteraceae bacterium]